MKISRWCSSSTSSRWWFQSASRFRDQCLSTTVLSHLHSRIAQGTHGDEYFLYKYSVYKSPLLVAVCVFVWVCQYDMYHDTGPVIPYVVIHYDTVGTIIWVFFVFFLAVHLSVICSPPAMSSIKSHNRHLHATLRSCSSNIQVRDCFLQ